MLNLLRWAGKITRLSGMSISSYRAMTRQECERVRFPRCEKFYGLGTTAIA